jgi:hypothetical protein
MLYSKPMKHMVRLHLDLLCVLASVSLTAATEQASYTNASAVKYKSVAYFTNWVHQHYIQTRDMVITLDVGCIRTKFQRARVER